MVLMQCIPSFWPWSVVGPAKKQAILVPVSLRGAHSVLIGLLAEVASWPTFRWLQRLHQQTVKQPVVVGFDILYSKCQSFKSIHMCSAQNMRVETPTSHGRTLATALATKSYKTGGHL